MIYEGQAKLKLYEDIACTREIELDIGGKYILSANCITGEPTHDYEKKIYIKNVGTHSAYNVSFSSNKGDISTTTNEIKANKVHVVTIKITMPNGEANSQTIVGGLNYTNLP